MLAAILVGATACGNDPAPATTAAVSDAKTGATADAAADSSGDTGANGSADTAAETQQAADASIPDTADAKPLDTASSSGSAVQTDAAAALDTAGDSAAAADSTAGDISVDTSLCPAPKPPGTVCEGSTWVCAPGYFHNYGNSVCLEATCANMKAALDAALAEVEAKTHGCSGTDEG